MWDIPEPVCFPAGVSDWLPGLANSRHHIGLVEAHSLNQGRHADNSWRGLGVVGTGHPCRGAAWGLIQDNSPVPEAIFKPNRCRDWGRLMSGVT